MEQRLNFILNLNCLPLVAAALEVGLLDFLNFLDFLVAMKALSRISFCFRELSLIWLARSIVLESFWDLLDLP